MYVCMYARAYSHNWRFGPAHYEARLTVARVRQQHGSLYSTYERGAYAELAYTPDEIIIITYNLKPEHTREARNRGESEGDETQRKDIQNAGARDETNL